MKTSSSRHSFAWRSELKFLALAFVGWAVIYSPTSVRADLSPWEKDIQFLTGKIAQLRSQLKQTQESVRQLSKADSAVGRLKEFVSQMTALQTEIDSAESRLRYLKVMELEPKSREVDRLSQYYGQLVTNIINDLNALNGEIKRHNDRRPSCPNDGSASGPCISYNNERDELNGRQARSKASLDRVQAEGQQAVERALQASAEAQKEFGETATKRDKLGEKMLGLKQEYAGVRGPLAQDMVGMEVSVPLTPFSNGVPPSEAGLTRRVPPPIGPCSNTHAIDQLLIVTSSSRSAAGRDDSDRNVNLGTDEIRNRVASVQSGYTFDTGGGMSPVQLPNVATPEGRPLTGVKPEPLILPAAPDERENAPEALRKSPMLKELKRQRSEELTNLNSLYLEHRQIVAKGPDATSKQLTANNKAINVTQSKLLWNVYLQGSSGGSKVTAAPSPLEPSKGEIDTTITPKPRRKKTSEIFVPPPGESAPTNLPEPK